MPGSAPPTTVPAPASAAGPSAAPASVPARETRPVSSTAVAAAPASPSGSPLPPIPKVVGPLAITVVYPKAEAVVMSRDSNFVLGSIGTGDATLAINGYPVTVAPNGAFLAWLPVPDSASPRYDLVAVRGADTARLVYPVRLMPLRRWMQDSVAADTLAQLRRPFPDSGRFVSLASSDSTLPDTDRVVIARPIPAGTYKWFFLPGTVVQVTGRSPGFERIRLDAELSVWVSVNDVHPLPPAAATRVPRRVVGTVRVVPAADWEDVILPVGERPPFLVEENGNDLVLTLYGTQALTDLIHYIGRGAGPPGPPDTLVQSIIWSQETSDRARYTMHLSQAPYGYLTMWSGGNLVVRVRRQPSVDGAMPLRGLTIAIDAGHPPAGSTGPTGLYEPVPTLAIAHWWTHYSWRVGRTW